MILYVETSIPEGMTIEGYRASRPERTRPRRRRLRITELVGRRVLQFPGT